MVLEGYNSLISDTLDGVTQVKTEISSLAGYLDQWRKGHCTEQRPKPSVPGPLQELQSRKEFIHTVSIEALMRVKELLNLLLKNLDQLQSCWKMDTRTKLLIILLSPHQWCLTLHPPSRSCWTFAMYFEGNLFLNVHLFIYTSIYLYIVFRKYVFCDIVVMLLRMFVAKVCVVKKIFMCKLIYVLHRNINQRFIGLYYHTTVLSKRALGGKYGSLY